MNDLVPPRPDVRGPRALSDGASATDRPGSRGSTWGAWEAIGVYLLAWVIGSIAVVPLFWLISNQDVAEIVASAVVSVVNVAVLLVWLSRRHPEWRSAVGFPRRAPLEVGWGLGFGVLLYPGIVVVGTVVSMLFRDAVGHAVSPPQQVPSHLPVFGVVVTVTYAIAIAPVHEELFFRGVLFRSLRDRYGFPLGAGASAVAFGLVHYIPASSAASSLLLMSIMVFTGLGLAFLYERRGNIVAPMVAHATFNAIGVILIFLVT